MTAGTMTEKQVSFSQKSVQEEIFSFAKELLNKEGRVYFDPMTGFAIVSHYEDVAYVTTHPEIFSNLDSTRMGLGDPEMEREIYNLYKERGFVPVPTLVTNDPPSHTKYRKLVERIFTPKKVKSFEAEINEIVDDLLDRLAGKGEGDLVSEFAVWAPLHFIMAHLGVAREHSARVKSWADAAIAAINPSLSREQQLELTGTLIEMQQFINSSAERYETEPAETLLSLLQHAEVDGERIDRASLVSIGTQLFVAGHETTAALIATTLYMLLSDPAQLEKARTEPESIPFFIEEALRLNPPVPHRMRRTLVDTEIAGVPISAGTVVQLSYVSANRDPDRWSDPDSLRTDREDARQHFSFGLGIHYCIGNILARTETVIAVSKVLERFPNIRLNETAPTPQWLHSFQAHALDSLPVRF